MWLVAQSPQLTGATITGLAALCAGTAIERLGATAVRMRAGVRDLPGKAARYARAHRIDLAQVPDDRRLDAVGLVTMDMDSTLITIECIDEIADMQGIKPQVAAITASAMRGEIDFAESLQRRVALLAGLDVGALARVYDERLRISPGAEAMLATFRAVGAKSLLVSGGFTFFTDRLRERLALDYTLSNVLEVRDGKLTGRVEGPIVDARAKAGELKRLRAAMPGKVAIGIGDGANDLPMLDAADVSIAYHAKPVVRARTTHCIDYCGLDAVANLFVPAP